MERQAKKGAFEGKLEQLEALVEAMETGGMSLEEMLAAYEKGMKLSRQLTLELEKAQTKLLKLRDGKLLEEGELDDA